MATARTAEILNAVEEENIELLLQKIKKFTEDNCLTETIPEFTKRQLEELWDGVLRQCVSQLLSTEEKNLSETSNILQCVSELALATIQAVKVPQDKDDDTPLGQQKQVVVPRSLQEMAVILHGIFPTLTDELALVKKRLCQMFESWWLNDMPCRQEVIGNTLAYLLAKSTELKSTQSDVVRVSQLQAALESVDLSNDSAQPLVTLLLQCVYHHHYVNTRQGLKFLVLLFTLDVSLAEKLHQSVKNHLKSVPKSWLEKYGEMYYRAWQTSSGDVKTHLEQACLQDLMFRALHAQRGGDNSMASILFKLLHYLHKQKLQRGVETLLHELYEPILWRALVAPNSDVRVNAAAILFDVFPLQDRSLHQEDADKALQNQFNTIYNLLSDPVVEVRLVTVKGVGSILNLYWELMPADVIQCLVTSLVQDLAYDNSSPSIREAVIKVMFQLCDNHLCIPMLKKVLPEFQNFIHDSSEKVRSAMLDLLLKVRGLRAIKFWSITPVEHILSRLEVDPPSITRKVMKLLYPSFVPQDQSPSEQIERIVTLVKENQGAARQFFLFLPQHLGVPETVKYITLICRYLLESSRQAQGSAGDTGTSGDDSTDMDNQENSASPNIASSRETKSSASKSKRNKKSKKSGKDETGDDDSVDEGDDDVNKEQGVEDYFLVYTGLAEGIYLMYSAILGKLSGNDNKAVKEGLAKKLSITVRELMSFSKCPSLDLALIALAGHLPSKSLPLLSQNLVRRLKDMALKGDNLSRKETESVAIIVKSLVMWGNSEVILDMVKESVDKLFTELRKDGTSGGKEGEKKGKKGKKAVGFVVEETAVSPMTAMKWVVAMLTPRECQPILQGKHKTQLLSLLSKLQPVMSIFDDSFAASVVPCDKMPILTEIFIVYLRLSAFVLINGPGENKENEDTRSSQQELEEGYSFVQAAFFWAKSIALPTLEEGGDQAKLDAAVKLTEAVLKTCRSLLMIGLCSKQQLEQISDLVTTLLQMPSPVVALLPATLTCMYQLTQIRPSSGDDSKKVDEMSPYLERCCDNICQFLQGFVGQLTTDESLDTDQKPERTKMVAAVSPGLCEVLQELTCPGRPVEMVERLVMSALKSSLTELTFASQQDNLNSDLPPLTSSLLTILRKRKACRRVVVDAMESKVDERQLTNIHELHGLVVLVGACRTQKEFSDLITPRFERRLSTFLSGLEPKEGEDEDFFKDLKSQVENRINSWLVPNNQSEQAMQV